MPLGHGAGFGAFFLGGGVLAILGGAEQALKKRALVRRAVGLALGRRELGR